MKDSRKAQSFKNVMRKFSRFAIVEEHSDQPLPTYKRAQNVDKYQTTKPSKNVDHDLESSARSTGVTVADELSMSLRSYANDDDFLLMSERFDGDYDDEIAESARFSTSFEEYDEPLQRPMRRLSHSFQSCVLEVSDRTEYTTSGRSGMYGLSDSERYTFGDNNDPVQRHELGSSMFSSSGIDDSFRSLGLDISARTGSSNER